jgi:hypothetical protein
MFPFFIVLFPPDKHRKRRQNPAKDQSVGEINGSVNFCDHRHTSFRMV